MHLDRRSTALCVIGVGLLVAGFFYPGSQSAVATTLVVMGSGEVAVGLLLPRMTELEIGPGGVKTKIAVALEQDATLFEVQPASLTRFAVLMCGDPDQGRELVEEALARGRQHQRRLSQGERGVFVLRTLVDLLDTATERSWLRGETTSVAGSLANDGVAEALRSLEFGVRAAFLLRVDWPLRSEEVASVLGRTVDAVRTDVELARERLRPLIAPVAGP
jgi:DNA-directed RNA polymerase specialized sigma24 family protein